jgi:hypothetical protein
MIMKQNLITELKRYKELMLITEAEGLFPAIVKTLDNIISGVKTFSTRAEKNLFADSVDNFLTEFPDLGRTVTNVDDEFTRVSKIVSELSTSTNELAISKFLKLINSNTKLEASFVKELITNKPLLKDLGALEYDDFKLFLNKVGIEDPNSLKKITNSLLTDPSILTTKKIFNWAYQTVKVDKAVINKNADNALVELLTNPNTKEQFNVITQKRNTQVFLDNLYNKIAQNVSDPTYENVLTYVTDDIQKMYDELPANYKTSWINKFLKGYKFEGNKLTSLLQWYLTIGFVISGYSIIQSYKIKDALFSKWLQNKYPEWDTMTDDRKNIALSEWNEYFLSKTAQKFLYTPLWLPAIFISDIKDALSEKISVERANQLWDKTKDNIKKVTTKYIDQLEDKGTEKGFKSYVTNELKGDGKIADYNSMDGFYKFNNKDYTFKDGTFEEEED